MNKLILGTVQFGLDYGINNQTGKISFENSCTILRKAFELGITTLDTAEVYGNAHQVIGEYHKLNPKLKFNIITKIPSLTAVRNIESKVNNYISDLNIDFLTVLMFHSFESYIKNKAILSDLIRLKEQGFIENIGVSVYTNEQIEALMLVDEITVVQMPFNLFDNNFQRGDIMKRLKEKGKTIHTRSSFLQGLFFKDTNSQIETVQKLKKELALLSNITKRESASISELALSYCLKQDYIDNVLIGVDSINQLVENVNSANYKIRTETINEINEIRIQNLDLLNPSLWK